MIALTSWVEDDLMILLTQVQSMYGVGLFFQISLVITLRARLGSLFTIALPAFNVYALFTRSIEY